MKVFRLVNKTKNCELANKVRVASSFFDRARGLLGEKSLPRGQALWIQGTKFVGCNSIHTFFMRFAIDAVFVDHNLKVRAVYTELSPWRMTWPAKGARSVFELPAGTLKESPVDIGDELHVGN